MNPYAFKYCEEKLMKEKLDALLREGTEKIAAAQTEAQLQEVKSLLLGKQGSITELLKEIPKLDVSLRPVIGKEVNKIKTLLSEQIDSRREELKLKASEISPDFDCTIPGFEPITSAAFWGFLWRWSKVRGKHPGGIWSFLYLLIISLDIYSGISQIWLAIA